MKIANLVIRIISTILLVLIVCALIELIHTVDDKGINIHLYQKISTDYCSWDVTTKKGTVIHMNAPVSTPE